MVDAFKMVLACVNMVGEEKIVILLFVKETVMATECALIINANVILTFFYLIVDIKIVLINVRKKEFVKRENVTVFKDIKERNVILQYAQINVPIMEYVSKEIVNVLKDSRE
jgi:hypothetical protein